MVPGPTLLIGPLDIRLTKDGEIVMMHDMTLNRTTTGTGTIGQVNWHGYIDSLVTKTDPPQPIPRFKEVVQLMLRQDVIDKNMYMIVDIKVKRTKRKACGPLNDVIL